MFKKIPGMKAKLYVPDKQDNSEKKHNCDDCHFCQWCSDERCAGCLKRSQCKDCKNTASKKME